MMSFCGKSEGKPEDENQAYLRVICVNAKRTTADYFFAKISSSRHLPIAIAGGVEYYIPMEIFDLDQVESVPRRQRWFI